ncbi:MAG TPA: nuclear transport factor 2 family protein [Acidimicrobiales bacterium]|nr:nuclear transport factor 2 family protein [Acidimicrobiales bacterium]
MPEETVLHRYARAWQDGDLDGVLACYHPDLVIHYFGSSPLAGDHVGFEAAVTALAQATARSARVLERVVDVLVGAERSALVVEERLGVAGDEPGRVVQRVLVFRVEDARLRECWLFDEDQRFVDALWSTT